MRRSLAFGLLGIWMLATGASCETTVQGGHFSAQASGTAAVAGVAVFLLGTGVYCLAYGEACAPDKAEVQARAGARARAQGAFTAGLRRYREGDPAGLEGICLAAHGGYAGAQYFYGTHIFRQGPGRVAEGVAWLRRAAAQGHREADILLRQVNGRAGPAGSDTAPAAIGPPTFMGCMREGTLSQMHRAAGPA